MGNGYSGSPDRRVPPQSVEAEEAVLGGVLLDNRALDRAIELLKPEDFYREAHRRVFRALIDLDERREPADVITLTECLKSRGDLEAVGGAAAIAELAERTATAANVGYYAKIVKEKSILRSLVEAASDIVTRGYEGIGDVDQFLDEAEQAVFAISERKIKPAFAKIESIIFDAIKTIEFLHERQQVVTGVPTGFIELDKLTAGLQASDLIIIAGRPAMGKSALATNIGQYAATHAGKAVALFSLEMSKEQLVLRMLCAEAGVDSSKVRTGYLRDRDFGRLAAAAGRLAELPFFIDDTAALSVLELRAKTRRLTRESKVPLGLVVVDYLQLMRAHRDVDNREQEISLISRSLKALAKELSIPVVALSQLNRQVEQRADKRPAMADLRESGAIEQDADVIAFVYRDEVYNKVSAEEGTAEIIIAKQRNGPTGTVKLAFRKELTKFENLSTRAEDEEAAMVEDAEP
ncbi:MAG TPA: replicative DNA helicase [Candidatus Bathyarchaeia archaeon]|nr:replicative DNA helicase [Candidatus Bathyarchaeia archaeon]